MLPLILNFDDSVTPQRAVATQATEIIDLTTLRDDLRLSASPRALAQLRQTIAQLRAAHPEPWLTFLGSGDFHHVSLALIESAPKPFHLILIDNHPDWFFERPTFHCGNWLSGALDHVQSATLIGQNSADLKPHRFRRAPFNELCTGRVTLFPHSLPRVFVPFKYSKHRHGNPFGTPLTFDTLTAHGPQPIFNRIATQLANQNVYLSIDKDVLLPTDAITDWDQGHLSLPDLASGIHVLRATCHIIGADICGDRSPHPLRGFSKRLDARRRKHTHHSDSTSINELANLTLVSALTDNPVPAAARVLSSPILERAAPSSPPGGEAG